EARVLQLAGRAELEVFRVAEKVDALRRLEIADGPDGGDVSPRLFDVEIPLQRELVEHVAQDVADGQVGSPAGQDLVFGMAPRSQDPLPAAFAPHVHVEV